MELNINQTIAQIRTAIDDVKGTVDDDFSADVDLELTQALRHSVEGLLMELPATLVIPTVMDRSASLNVGTMGDGWITLPTTFLRFLNIKLNWWKGTLYELIESGSEEEKRQRSQWSRGTNTKPKAMLDTDDSGNRIVRCWPADSGYSLDKLSYVPMWSESNGVISCALRDEVLKNVIYAAASIFLEGKKESELAEKFKALATL